MPLYVVATPIGNLDDITLRALTTLREADLIAAEDTRTTKKLLTLHEIKDPKLISYHEHNERERCEMLAERALGENVVLVSDGGMPLVSDPGYRVVSKTIELGGEVIPVPGASAVMGALVAAGLATHAFAFLGFPPRKSGGRQKFFEEQIEFDGALIFFESPHRIEKSLRAAAKVLGERKACVAREMTKLHEEFVRGTLTEIADVFSKRAPKGECTVVIDCPR